MSPDSKRVLRTALQIIVGLASALPLLIHTANLPDTLPGVGVALTVASFITKAMAKWNGLLPTWLRVDAPPVWVTAAVPSGPRHAADSIATSSGSPVDTTYTPVTGPADPPAPPST